MDDLDQQFLTAAAQAAACYGAEAEAMTAYTAAACAERGDKDGAAMWHRIHLQVIEMRKAALQ